MARPSPAASPSPTLPLLILGLVLFMAMGPWFMSSESAVEESVYRARRGAFGSETLILVPAIILIAFQFYGSYEQGIIRRRHWKMPDFSITDSIMALVGFAVLVVALMWIKSAVKDMILSL